jgi:catechol 2,3-dioxygenase-like lactoylglutathione lyase family enzyme
MIDNLKINHIALCSRSEDNAKLFYNEILGIPLIKKFEISKDLSNKIFKINKNIQVLVFEYNKIKFEIFISEINYFRNFNHICIEIDDKKKLIERCNKNNIKYFYVKKNNKILLFITDIDGNLFEIK